MLYFFISKFRILLNLLKNIDRNPSLFLIRFCHAIQYQNTLSIQIDIFDTICNKSSVELSLNFVKEIVFDTANILASKTTTH